jgi:hypothetical protein
MRAYLSACYACQREGGREGEREREEKQTILDMQLVCTQTVEHSYRTCQYIRCSAYAHDFCTIQAAAKFQDMKQKVLEERDNRKQHLEKVRVMCVFVCTFS